MHNQSQSDRFTTQIQGKAGRLEPVFVAAWIGVSMFSAPLPGQELALDRLATRCDYTAGRITSHDPKGSNQDFWVIAPGETRVLAEITGPGSIVHFHKNNDGGWWGEGDEIVFVDGRQTIQGTGSEDYFCQSYGLRPGCFPYSGVTMPEEPFTKLNPPEASGLQPTR